MGVLDDAIREHIELKRQHGANASELERQEHEALGPARREAQVSRADDEPPDDGAAMDELTVEEAAVEDTRDAEPAQNDAPRPLPPEFGERPSEEAAFDAPPEPDFTAPTPVPPADEPIPEPEEFTAQPSPTEPDFIEASPGPAPGEPPAEDVLEETPEFLQETPEHDRLWFEQKPPRDFDFDE